MKDKKAIYKDEQLYYSLTYEDIVQIFQILDEYQYSNLSMELGDLKLKIRKDKLGDAEETSEIPAVYQTQKEVEKAPDKVEEPVVASSETYEVEKEEVNKDEPEVAEGHVTVNASLTGVFYEAPSQDEPPFVEVGSEVKKGDELGIIEVMKLFNSVNAPCDGVIKEIIVSNESIVETGEVLMVIEPA